MAEMFIVILEARQPPKKCYIRAQRGSIETAQSDDDHNLHPNTGYVRLL